MSNNDALMRSFAAVRSIKAFGGIFAGSALFYLGVSGKVIPKEGLPASATFGLMLGDTGVRAFAILVGLLAMIGCSMWMRATLRHNSRKN